MEKELLKRYLYLNENKELVLSLCIDYKTRKDYYKKLIEKKVGLKKQLKQRLRRSKLAYDYRLCQLLEQSIEEDVKHMMVSEPYLCAQVSDNIVNEFEEFLFTDDNIETTTLYNQIESIKNNKEKLLNAQEKIKALEERRQKNMCLKKVPTFTVWKILTYVRNKNIDNAAVIEALEKYYNLDRCKLTGVNWESGYKLLPVDYESEEKLSNYPSTSIIGSLPAVGLYNAVKFDYPGNEIEQEDNYVALDCSLEFDKQPTINEPKTNFMRELASMPMLSEELKQEMYSGGKSLVRIKNN